MERGRVEGWVKRRIMDMEMGCKGRGDVMKWGIMANEQRETDGV